MKNVKFLIFFQPLLNPWIHHFPVWFRNIFFCAMMCKIIKSRHLCFQKIWKPFKCTHLLGFNFSCSYFNGFGAFPNLYKVLKRKFQPVLSNIFFWSKWSGLDHCSCFRFGYDIMLLFSYRFSIVFLFSVAVYSANDTLYSSLDVNWDYISRYFSVWVKKPNKDYLLTFLYM